MPRISIDTNRLIRPSHKYYNIPFVNSNNVAREILAAKRFTPLQSNNYWVRGWPHGKPRTTTTTINRWDLSIGTFDLRYFFTRVPWYLVTNTSNQQQPNNHWYLNWQIRLRYFARVPWYLATDASNQQQQIVPTAHISNHHQRAISQQKRTTTNNFAFLLITWEHYRACIASTHVIPFSPFFFGLLSGGVWIAN